MLCYIPPMQDWTKVSLVGQDTSAQEVFPSLTTTTNSSSYDLFFRVLLLHRLIQSLPCLDQCFLLHCSLFSLSCRFSFPIHFSLCHFFNGDYMKVTVASSRLALPLPDPVAENQMLSGLIITQNGSRGIPITLNIFCVTIYSVASFPGCFWLLGTRLDVQKVC